MTEDFTREAEKLSALVRGKTVRQVWRRAPQELGVEFTDGTRLFVNVSGDELEVSVSGGPSDRPEPPETPNRR